ncbi:MAG TPA: oligopeptide transporter, OPT family [Candidatus Saccharimonadales bacterium]|nr:oligopeptide transporter, OPT family [Candidatus Saccharimonadales bacterium]
MSSDPARPTKHLSESSGGGAAPGAYEPYIPASARLPEFTPIPIVMGTLLGMVFGASSLYLVLKVGLTVSASIPVAVLSITFFRILSKLGARDATILENNIVQIGGSAGESIAFGVGVTMPAIMILGFDLEIWRVMLVGLLGGLLGILMMIPLRRALIVQQHGVLKYPEGTACAEVLIAGASPDSRAAAATGKHSAASDSAATPMGARTIFTGFGVGFAYHVVMEALRGWKDIPQKVFGAPFKAASIAAEISPALLGVGYIIGPKISSTMCGGGVLAYLVLIPLIKFFGEGMTRALPPGTVPISEMDPSQIRGAYVLYIGAGAVAAGGIISLFRSLPTIWHSLKEGVRDVKASPGASASALRTEQDLSMRFVVGGIILLIAMIMFFHTLHMNLLGAVLIVIFGFLFVTVSSRLVGEIGSSSNPISGMTVATLLLTCLVFVLVGWTGPTYYVTALSVGGIVCIAASNGGATSQGLKAGFLVGGTPRPQQISILIGAFASALILGPILLKLNDAATVYVPRLTFEAARGAAAALPADKLRALPAYAEAARPPVPGEYRLLTVAPGTAPPVAGLEPGEYLVTASGALAYRVQQNFPGGMHAPAAAVGVAERIRGPQAVSDAATYHVWQKTTDAGGPQGRYLVNAQGEPVYLVDPGINGVHRERPDGSTVTKYDAPKATLMSYIIKGILNRQLPWGLVLLGVMIAIVLEMAGIPSLAFAVGVYLPISSSTPIFVGGMVRWLVDHWLKTTKFKGRDLTPEQLNAEGDKSPGVLMASGYIAGGAIAGIVVAFLAGVLSDVNAKFESWSTAHNPFFNGPNADLLSMLPFLALTALLYLTGREVVLAGKKTP